MLLRHLGVAVSLVWWDSAVSPTLLWGWGPLGQACVQPLLFWKVVTRGGSVWELQT